MRVIVACFSAVIALTGLADARAEENFGSFKGDLVVKALPNGRNLELVQPFSYVDDTGKLWAVPTGTVVDGASIPGAFWSFIGGPFEDKYREASVIHDHYCNEQSETWQDVHMVFYKGMLARGVDLSKAKMMYAAVYAFGPRWVEVQAGKPGELISGQPVLLDQAKQAIVKFVSEQNPSLKDIQDLSRRVTEVQNLEQLENILTENGNCTPILAGTSTNAAAGADLKQTIILCGLSERSKKQAAVKNLRTLITQLNKILGSNIADYIPAVQTYVAKPTPENWAKVKGWSSNIYGLVKTGIRSTLDVQDDQVRDLAPPLDDVFGLLSSRAAMIKPILDGEPKSAQQMEAWSEKYLDLIRKLQGRLQELESHLSKSEGYP